MNRKLSMMLLSLMLLVALLPLQSTAAQDDADQELTKVRVAVIPVLDTLPFFIAVQNGYFEAQGLDVELLPVTSPPERDALIQAGEADAMLTDIQGVGFFNERSPRVQIVLTTRIAQADAPVFRILAAPRSNITIPSDLEGIAIGVSENTIIEYLTDRLLADAGVENIVTEPVPQIPVRFQLLMSGELQAATLPDPLAQAAIQAGAIEILDDTVYADSGFSQSVLVFTTDFIEDHPAAVNGFVQAWDQAVADLNADPEAYRALFLEKTVVPETVQDTYLIPPFPRSLITSEAVWDDTMAWMLDKGIIDEAPAYADSVTVIFVPAAPAVEAEATQETTDEAGD